jgi:hypothetical protein
MTNPTRWNTAWLLNQVGPIATSLLPQSTELLQGAKKDECRPRRRTRTRPLQDDTNMTILWDTARLFEN